MEIEKEKTDSEYLRDLSDRLLAIPVMYGVNQYDAEELLRIAKKLTEKE